MIYNVTFYFRGQGIGWSESHAVRYGNTSPELVLPRAISVAQKRVQLLGREFEIHAIRIAKYSDDEATERFKGVYLLKQIFKNSVQTNTMAAEPAVVAFLVRGGTNGNGAPAGMAANTNRTYLGAPPDTAVDNAGIVDPSKANVQVNFDQWASTLLANDFGWIAFPQTQDLKIKTISQTTDGYVQIVTDPPTGTPPVIGTAYKARARRVNNSRSPLNGELIVIYTAANTWVTQEVIGLAVAQSGGFLKVYKKIGNFLKFASLTLDLETAKHQRGRPFGVSPGRAPRRIRG